MKMNKIYYTCAIATLLALAGCEDKIDPLEDQLVLARVLAPTGLEPTVKNLTTVQLVWNTRGDADHYVVEFSEDSLQFNTIIHTEEVKASQLPYQHAFAGATRYSARVKAVSAVEGVGDSKWTSATVMTAQEDIFLPVQDNDITANDVILRWPANSAVTRILVTPGNIDHVISAQEIAAGVVKIAGLTGETDYTAKLFNESKSRGTKTFTTLIDLNGAIAIKPGDDLKVILDAAAEGASYVVFPGTYTLGTYALTKSIKLTGYKTNDKPVIMGSFTCGATVESVELKSLIFRGNADAANVISAFFNTMAGCNLTTLTISDCEISDFQNTLIYNNVAGTKYGAVTISNSYVHDFLPAGGGDGIDFRTGTITSFSVENTTFSKGFRAFLRMQVACNTLFTNCTFYKISAVDNSNNTGLFRAVGGTLGVKNSLFVETGVAAPSNATSGNWTRNAGSMTATPTYSNNNIFGCLNLLVGLYTSASQVSATQLNPALADAANGNFKITNQTLIDNNIGDLHWK